MHGRAKSGAQRIEESIEAADGHGKAPRVEAFVIGQVAGRPLYLVIGEDAEHRLAAGLPFNDG